MQKKYMLYLMNKYNCKITQYGPVLQADSTWAYRFATSIFQSLLKQYQGSYIVVEEYVG